MDAASDTDVFAIADTRDYGIIGNRLRVDSNRMQTASALTVLLTMASMLAGRSTVIVGEHTQEYIDELQYVMHPL